MSFPADYIERVYAGVLGKIIGVYLGRPFESWSHERISAELGEINYYVHDKLGVPLVVADDDLSGTFTFLRALADFSYPNTITAAQIGQAWLNYIVENRAILWWGGLGNSTEHTAYLRLKHGISAPQSGSITLNGKVVAEQIGAQIFIDGWAMVSPGNPDAAVALAQKAASVSHDGEAIYGAQVLAAMEAQAFVEDDIHTLLDIGVSYIPQDSVIYRLIHDIRIWHRDEPDWRTTRALIAEKYGYDIYGGNCHIVPNHALIILALLYGDNDFQKSLKIVNTSGWDTDCNSGNVGCLLGIKNGLQGINAGPDWRGPVADRLYLPTADGSRCVTDAVTETYSIVNTARRLDGVEPINPKHNARFHFELPGSVQGFYVQMLASFTGKATLENVVGFSRLGERSLALHYAQLEPGHTLSLATPTFLSAEEIGTSGYTLLASPTLYSSQILRGAVTADTTNSTPMYYRPFISYYEDENQLARLRGPVNELTPGQFEEFTWRIPDTANVPIANVGIEFSAEQTTQGSVYLDFLTWDGTPHIRLAHPQTGGGIWQHAWVNAVDRFESWYPETYRLVQNEGRGLISIGTRQWTDYRVSTIIAPHMARATGIAARVQGLRRYYALLIAQDNTARLVKYMNDEQVVASTSLDWVLDRPYELSLQVREKHIQAWIDGKLTFDVQDDASPLLAGGIALLCEEGRIESNAIHVEPV